MRETMIRMPTSRFIKVRCLKCRNEQVIFDKAAMEIKCLNCGETIAKPTGGKIKLINAEIVKVFG